MPVKSDTVFCLLGFCLVAGRLEGFSSSVDPCLDTSRLSVLKRRADEEVLEFFFFNGVLDRVNRIPLPSRLFLMVSNCVVALRICLRSLRFMR